MTDGDKKPTLYGNLFGGPGTGKSTVMAAVFAELKWRGIDCEMVTEYAKDKVWEGSPHVLECPAYIFGKQRFRLFRMEGKVKIVITDSPILLAPVYDKSNSKAFLTYVLEQMNQHRNFNIFLNRMKGYNPNGRTQTFDAAKELDQKIKALLESTQTPYEVFSGTRESVALIADRLEEMAK